MITVIPMVAGADLAIARGLEARDEPSGALTMTPRPAWTQARGSQAGRE